MIYVYYLVLFVPVIYILIVERLDKKDA